LKAGSVRLKVLKKHAEIMTIFDLHGIMLHLSKHVGLVSMVYKFYKTIF